MKLTCPKCHAKSIIADERVPAKGAWARCPKCSERFFITPQGQGAALGQAQPASPAPSPARERSEEAQQLLTRLKAKRTENGTPPPEDGAYESEVIVFPELAASPTPYFIILGVMSLFLVGLVIHAFNSASMPPPATPRSAPQVARQYDESSFAADLTMLRRHLINQGQANRRTKPAGLEARIFQYALSRLAPNECEELEYLFLQSARTLDGVTVLGVCQDPSRRSPQLDVRWHQGIAQVRVVGYDNWLSVVLISRPGRASSRAASAADEK